MSSLWLVGWLFTMGFLWTYEAKGEAPFWFKAALVMALGVVLWPFMLGALVGERWFADA